MNIIKLKDMIMPDDMPWANLFNNHLKGKYAYWIQMRYIVSFDHMKHEGYVACEEDITKLIADENNALPKPYGAPSIDIYDSRIIPYIDVLETDKINSIRELRLKNQYVADNDITIDEIKKFRTWLATQLLDLDKTEFGIVKNILYNELEQHVLEYYQNGMYDNTIKILSQFPENYLQFQTINKTNCGCSHNSDLSSLYNDSINVCNPIELYKTNIYNEMIKMFSNLDFWTRYPAEFIYEFKKYIDNIIRLDLPLVQSSLTDSFIDCNCINNTNQEQMKNILKRLSTTLEYIFTNNIISHKNYIIDALRDWSSQLYENMEW